MRFLRFWFRRLLPFYFRFWGSLGTRAALIRFLGSFLAPETDMIFGDGVGASLLCQLSRWLRATSYSLRDWRPKETNTSIGPATAATGILNLGGPFLPAAFCCVLRTKKVALFVILFCSNFHSLEALEACLEPAWKPDTICLPRGAISKYVDSTCQVETVSIFLGRISFFSFAPRLSEASQLVTKMWHQKWARHTAPCLESRGTISVAVPKQPSMELEGQNWVPQKDKLKPKIGANFWSPLFHHLLTAWCYFKIH